MCVQLATWSEAHFDALDDLANTPDAPHIVSLCFSTVLQLPKDKDALAYQRLEVLASPSALTVAE